MIGKKHDSEKKGKKEEQSSMTAGQAFVKMIGPFGSIMFLVLFVLFLIYCFTGGFGL